MSTSMDPWTDEVHLELGMCLKFRKTSVLTKEQEISCTWVLHCSNSSSVCVGSSKRIRHGCGNIFGESEQHSFGEAENYLDHCRWKVLDLGNGREDFRCCVYSISFIDMLLTLYKQPFFFFFP